MVISGNYQGLYVKFPDQDKIKDDGRVFTLCFKSVAPPLQKQLCYAAHREHLRRKEQKKQNYMVSNMYETERIISAADDHSNLSVRNKNYGRNKRKGRRSPRSSGRRNRNNQNDRYSPRSRNHNNNNNNDNNFVDPFL